MLIHKYQTLSVHTFNPLLFWLIITTENTIVFWSDSWRTDKVSGYGTCSFVCCSQSAADDIRASLLMLVSMEKHLSESVYAATGVAVHLPVSWPGLLPNTAVMVQLLWCFLHCALIMSDYLQTGPVLFFNSAHVCRLQKKTKQNTEILSHHLWFYLIFSADKTYHKCHYHFCKH